MSNVTETLAAVLGGLSALQTSVGALAARMDAVEANTGLLDSLVVSPPMPPPSHDPPPSPPSPLPPSPSLNPPVPPPPIPFPPPPPPAAIFHCSGQSNGIHQIQTSSGVYNLVCLDGWVKVLQFPSGDASVKGTSARYSTTAVNPAGLGIPAAQSSFSKLSDVDINSLSTTGIWKFNCSGVVTLITNAQRLWASNKYSGMTNWQTDRDGDGTMDCPAITRPEYDVFDDWGNPAPLPGASTTCSIADCRSYGGADSEANGGCFSCALQTAQNGIGNWMWSGELWVR